MPPTPPHSPHRTNQASRCFGGSFEKGEVGLGKIQVERGPGQSLGPFEERARTKVGVLGFSTID